MRRGSIYPKTKILEALPLRIDCIHFEAVIRNRKCNARGYRMVAAIVEVVVDDHLSLRYLQDLFRHRDAGLPTHDDDASGRNSVSSVVSVKRKSCQQKRKCENSDSPFHFRQQLSHARLFWQPQGLSSAMGTMSRKRLRQGRSFPEATFGHPGNVDQSQTSPCASPWPVTWTFPEFRTAGPCAAPSIGYMPVYQYPSCFFHANPS